MLEDTMVDSVTRVGFLLYQLKCTVPFRTITGKRTRKSCCTPHGLQAQKEICQFRGETLHMYFIVFR
jgi:hypothetical protein